jgi:hypothetical protein
MVLAVMALGVLFFIGRSMFDVHLSKQQLAI